MTDRNRTIALIGALAIVTLIIIAIIDANMTGRPIDGWLPPTLAFAVPTITGLLTAAGVRSDIATVQRTVNGNLERIKAERDELAGRVAGLNEHIIALESHIDTLESHTTNNGRHAQN